jgi:FkbM family methyltransferase
MSRLLRSPVRSWFTRAREAVARGREIRAQSRYQHRRHLPDLLSAVLPGPVWALFPHRLVGVVLGRVVFEPMVNAGPVSRFGNYTIEASSLDEKAVVYSVGLGGNATFDVELAERIGCEIHVFDPTPAVLDRGAELEAAHETVTFHPEAMWVTCGTVPMYGHPAPNRNCMKFGSLAEPRWGDQVVEVPATTLSVAMERLGHERVDLLKADIEGGALPLVASVLRNDDVPGQIAVEFEVPLGVHQLLSFVGEVTRVVRRAEARGFSAHLVAHKRGAGLEVLFIGRSARGDWFSERASQLLDPMPPPAALIDLTESDLGAAARR